MGSAQRGASERWRHVAAVLALGLLTTTASASSATAHSGSLPDAAYYRSTITAVTPTVAGLEVTLDQAGESVTLTNRTGALVEVPGYTGEPYLRISTTDVQENRNSLSAFLNGSLVIAGLPQEQSGTAAPPQWHQVASTPSFTWHDHRLHWMAQQRPPVVEADPTSPHPVFDWKLPLKVGGTPVVVTGSLRWIGAPRFDTFTLSLMVLAGTVIVLGLGLVVIRVRRSRETAEESPDGEHAAPVPGEGAQASR